MKSYFTGFSIDFSLNPNDDAEVKEETIFAFLEAKDKEEINEIYKTQVTKHLTR